MLVLLVLAAGGAYFYLDWMLYPHDKPHIVGLNEELVCDASRYTTEFAPSFHEGKYGITLVSLEKLNDLSEYEKYPYPQFESLNSIYREGELTWEPVFLKVHYKITNYSVAETNGPTPEPGLDILFGEFGLYPSEVKASLEVLFSSAADLSRPENERSHVFIPLGQTLEFDLVYEVGQFGIDKLYAGPDPSLLAKLIYRIEFKPSDIQG